MGWCMVVPVLFVLLAGAAGARATPRSGLSTRRASKRDSIHRLPKAIQKDYDSVNAYWAGGRLLLQPGRLRLTRSWIVPAAGPNRISMPSERFAQVNNLLGLVK